MMRDTLSPPCNNLIERRAREIAPCRVEFQTGVGLYRAFLHGVEDADPDRYRNCAMLRLTDVDRLERDPASRRRVWRRYVGSIAIRSSAVLQLIEVERFTR